METDSGPSGAAALSSLISPIQAYLNRLHAQYATLRDGTVATYIPELGKANPDWFGICLATTDGHVYEVGDTRQPFTIQSISKPFTYGLAMEDRGRDAVLRKIGVEPSGEAFNSISLAPGSGCPLNPMINAGAIAATSLVAGHSSDDTLQRLLGVLSLYAGRLLTLDRAVFESERDSGHRNRAIGHMLRNFEILTSDPEPALTLYFQQCSIAVDARDLSLMAATLANGGVNPHTGERAVRHDLVENILSVMTTCGMYDYAGEWVYWVGMPAKSGVAGGILAVLPGQLGIGVFSPPLDARGNSVRGVAVCRALSHDLNLHSLRVPRVSRSAIRAQYSLETMSSKRLRSPLERGLLDAMGGRVRVYDLHGDVAFSSVEAVVRAIVDASPHLDVVVLNFKRVSQIDDCVAAVFLELIVAFGARGKQVVLVDAQRHTKFLRLLEEGLTAADQWGLMFSFPDVDLALEWCENHLIAAYRPDLLAAPAAALAEHHLCQGLTAEELGYLERLMRPIHCKSGELIIRKGEPAQDLYLLMSGQVSVTVDLPTGQIKRLATLLPGMTFGELAVIDRAPRTADVRADTAAECYALSAADLDALGGHQPAIKTKILENLLRHIAQMVSRLNDEVWTLAH